MAAAPAGRPAADSAVTEERPMTRVSVLDPTAPPPEISMDPGPAAGSLAIAGIA